MSEKDDMVTKAMAMKGLADALVLLEALKDWASGAKVLTISRHLSWDANENLIAEVTDISIGDTNQS